MGTFSRVVRTCSELSTRSVAFRVVLAVSPVFDVCNQSGGKNLLSSEGLGSWEEVGGGQAGFELGNHGSCGLELMRVRCTVHY